MNVYAYLALVIFGGLIASYFWGRAKGPVTFLGATVQFLSVSAFLGFVLTIPVLHLVGILCFYWWGISDPARCIRTDQYTVWYLAAPFVFFPLYMVAMFVGRAKARHAGSDEEPPAA